MSAIQQVKETVFGPLLAWLFDGYWPATDARDSPPVTIQSPRRVYALQGLLATGDASDVYLATADEPPTGETCYLLKVARSAESEPLLETERSIPCRESCKRTCPS
jgi:hypothetical protein